MPPVAAEGISGELYRNVRCRMRLSLAQSFADKVAGAFLGLHVHFAQIFTHNAKAHHAKATQEPNTTREGGPTIRGTNAYVGANYPYHHR